MPMLTPPLGVPLRLDSANEWVWRGEQSLQLTSKAFAVLRYLVEHLGQVVTKEELLRTVWSDTVVSEWVLTTCIREIRKTLGEAAGAPQYIATVHRRGYRLIGPVQSLESRGQLESGVWSPESGVGAGDSALRDSGLRDSLREADPRRQPLDASLWIGRGQSIQHYGAGEA